MTSDPLKTRGAAHRRAVFILVAAGVVCAGIQLRYLPPGGERAFHPAPPGGVDMSWQFAGASALLAGVDPYINDVDPVVRGPMTTAGPCHNAYPPAVFILTLPFAAAYERWQDASRAYFFYNALLLLLLGLCTYSIARRCGALPDASAPWAAALVFIMACNGAAHYGLERGQTEITAAVLLWAGVAAFMGGLTLVGLLLALVATAAKLYAAPLVVGMVLFMVRRGQWRQVVLAVLAVAVTLVLPVRDLLDEARVCMGWRGTLYMVQGDNHSLRQFFELNTPALAAPLRVAFIALGAAGALACLWRAWRLKAPQQHLQHRWLVVGTTLIMALLVSLPPLAVDYALVEVLPGVAVVALGAVQPLTHNLRWRWRLPAEALMLLGAWLMFPLVALEQQSITAIGIVLFVAVTSVLALRPHRAPGTAAPLSEAR